VAPEAAATVAAGTRPGRRRRSLLTALLAGAVACAAAGGWSPGVQAADAASAVTRCEGGGVVVRGASAADVAQICAGARDAIAFFAGQQFATTVEVDIAVTGRLPDKVAPSAVGCYDPKRKRVYMLPYEQFVGRGDWFDLPIEPALYRSVAAHEVAHAIAACLFKAERPPLAAVEYVGYVAMISAMPPELRRRVLGRHPGGGFDAEVQINSTIYLMDPTHFAVESYRHFLRPEAGSRFLRDLFDGRVQLE
jgi:hypothetical protein